MVKVPAEVAMPFVWTTFSCGLLASCPSWILTTLWGTGGGNSYPDLIDEDFRINIALLFQQERPELAGFHPELWRSFWNSGLPGRPAVVRCRPHTWTTEQGMGLKEEGWAWQEEQLLARLH